MLCEVENIDFTAHESNTRAAAREVDERFAAQESWFGIEQEYTLFQDGRPLGFPVGGYPAPQGPYYCGAGADAIFGREVVEKHLDYCLAAGLKISGINAEVMPGQWEFQVGPAGPVEVSDHMWIARYLLKRTGEEFGVAVSFDAKPLKGDWNGAGAHTNFSTKAMREGYDAIITACEALGAEGKPLEHVSAYGAGIEDRLTGHHETAPWNKYSYGVSNRGASVRIPWQVEVDKKGYIEDRRPNANVDPYVVTRLIVEHVLLGAGEGRPGLSGFDRRRRGGRRGGVRPGSRGGAGAHCFCALWGTKQGRPGRKSSRSAPSHGNRAHSPRAVTPARSPAPPRRRSDPRPCPAPRSRSTWSHRPPAGPAV